MSNYDENDPEVAEALKLIDEMEHEAKFNALASYEPYPKQEEFHRNGATHKERLLMAGNRLGKTFSGGAEGAYHLTGEYPKNWKGRRFNHPIVMLTGSETAELTRKGVQRILIGPPAVPRDWGTGAIPQRCILETKRRTGVPDALDTVVVKHKSGGNSILQFLSYDQGREKWQADQAHVVWFDEEPPMDIYSEGYTRTVDTDGIVYMTFTPLKGMSEVVKRFLNEPSSQRIVTTMKMTDAKHMTPDKIAKALEGYPEHERDARADGVPMLGSGAIYLTAEAAVTYEPFDIPRFWAVLGGMDFGVGLKWAAILMAWNRDTDVVYIYDALTMKAAGTGAELMGASMHAAALKSKGPLIPFAWPQDGHAKDKGSGIALSKIYKAAGVNMLSIHAQFEDGSRSVEAGIMEIDEREKTGRIKYANHLTELLGQRRMYHREDGLIVKKDDHLLDAVRYAIMMKRYARTQDRLGQQRSKSGTLAQGADFDVFSR